MRAQGIRSWFRQSWNQNPGLPPCRQMLFWHILPLLTLHRDPLFEPQPSPSGEEIFLWKKHPSPFVPEGGGRSRGAHTVNVIRYKRAWNMESFDRNLQEEHTNTEHAYNRGKGQVTCGHRVKKQRDIQRFVVWFAFIFLFFIYFMAGWCGQSGDLGTFGLCVG